MNKFWIIYSRADANLVEYKSPQDALKKIEEMRLNNSNKHFFIMEPVLFTGKPPQSIDLTKEEYKDVPMAEEE